MGLIEKETNPLIRFKVTVVTILASIAPAHCFKKPVFLNILVKSNSR
jgi:hypothetical protein